MDYQAEDGMFIPPNNNNLEQEILSAIIINPDEVPEALEIIGPDDFYNTDNRLIFKVIQLLFNRGDPIDLTTIHSEMMKAGTLETIGGISYVAGIINNIPAALNVKHYSKDLKGFSLLRQLITLGNETMKRAVANGADPEKLISWAYSELLRIESSKTVDSMAPIGTVANTVLEKLKNKEHGSLEGFSSGFEDYDHLIGGFLAELLYILAARPSMGKSALALLHAIQAAKQGVKTLFISLEMSKEQLTRRALAMLSRINLNAIKYNMLGNEYWRKLSTVRDLLERMPLTIDDSTDKDFYAVIRKARKLHAKEGLGFIVVDYLQLMHADARNDRRDLEVAKMSGGFKDLARKLKIPVLLLSQLNRKNEERSKKEPMLSDLRESGAIEQDADVVTFIHRPSVYETNETKKEELKEEAKLIVAKQRDGAIGELGVKWKREFALFEPFFSNREI